MKTVEKTTLSLFGKSALLRKQVSAVGRKTEMCALNGYRGGMEKQNSLLLTRVSFRATDTLSPGSEGEKKTPNQDHWLHWVSNLLMVDLTSFLVPSPCVG